MTRVLLVASGALFGRGVERLLREESELEVVGCEPEAHRAVERIRELAPDVVIFEDSGTPGSLQQALLGCLGSNLRTKIIGLNAQDSTIRIYCGEQRVVAEVGDLLQVIQEGGARD